MRSRRLYTAILAATCLSLVASCATQPLMPPMPPPQAPPANLRQPCPPIPKSTGPLKEGDLYQADMDLIAQYGECALEHKRLIDAVTNPDRSSHGK